MRTLYRLAAFLFLMIGAWAANGCASWLDARDAVMPLSKLQKSVDAEFPVKGRYFDMYEVEATQPKLSLHPEANRIAATLGVRIAPTFMKRALQGQITISGVMRIDERRNAVVLAEPRLENMAINTATGIQPAILQETVAQIVENVFSNMVIYTFRREDLRTTFVSWRPSNIRVRSDSIVVSFEPE